MTFKKLTLLLILIAIKFSAQSEDKENVLSVGAFYQSDMVYMGRKDATKVPLVVPNFEYSLKNGIFFAGEGYLDAKSFKLDGGYFAIGYELDQENWGASLDVSKFFFNTNTNLVRSDTKFSIDGSLYYDLNWVTLNFNPSYSFGTKGSLVLASGISKEIDFDEITDNSDIHLTPKLYFWAGNENIITNHLLKKRRKTIDSKTSAKTFHLTSIEFDLLSEYIINKKFKISIDPLLAIPENYKELGSYFATDYPKEIFVLTAGVSYSF
jgi:hypothetical protein